MSPHVHRDTTPRVYHSQVAHNLSCHPDPLVFPVSPGVGPAPRSSGSSSGGSTEDIPSAVPPKDLEGGVRQIFLDYSTYMARFVPAQVGSSLDQSPPHGALGSPTPTKVSGTNPALGARHEC